MEDQTRSTNENFHLRNRFPSDIHTIVERKTVKTTWTVLHFYSLPQWLQDNEYLHHWHRPPLPSFGYCLKSIFRLHTETVNIWTHMIGCLAFVGVAIYFLTHGEIHWKEKIIMSPYLIGTIVCLGLSMTFHIFTCHSEEVGRFFGRLDYFGISLLITCSFIPSLYYAFYCHFHTKLFYIGVVIILGCACALVTLWKKFTESRFRPLRAGVFISLGLFGIIPTIHKMMHQGYWSTVYEASFIYLLLMAMLYLCGGVMYALRVPERFFPGRCDVLFHSHQFMHTLVVIAAFVHYQGISVMARERSAEAICEHEY